MQIIPERVTCSPASISSILARVNALSIPMRWLGFSHSFDVDTYRYHMD